MPAYAQLQAEVWWQREYQPPSLAALCEQLRQHFGVDAAALGSKGDNSHLYGYHRSRAWILSSAFSAYGDGDYSVQAAADQQGDPNWLCAVDFTPGDADTMISVCQRLDAAAKAGKTPQLREWYGNVDGDQVVDGWDLLADRAASSDSSHLWHLHMSFLRGRANDDHGNLFRILTGQVPARPKDDEMFMLRDDNESVALVDGVDPATRKVRAYWVTDPAAFADYLAAGIEVRQVHVINADYYVLNPPPPSGPGGAVDYGRIEQIVDRQLDQQSLGGADKD